MKVLGQQLSQDSALQVISCFAQWVLFGALHMDDVPYDAAGNLIGRTFQLLKGECTPTNLRDPSFVYAVLAFSVRLVQVQLVDQRSRPLCKVVPC